MPVEKPAKRARGSYAKLICLRCRERRIKCQLPNEQSVQPSPNPQPLEKACERCTQKGLECIVRKTTLGRPSHKHKVLPEIDSSKLLETSRSPSPEADDFVLLRLGNESDNDERGQPVVAAQPTSIQLMGGKPTGFVAEWKYCRANTNHLDSCGFSCRQEFRSNFCSPCSRPAVRQ